MTIIIILTFTAATTNTTSCCRNTDEHITSSIIIIVSVLSCCEVCAPHPTNTMVIIFISSIILYLIYLCLNVSLSLPFSLHLLRVLQYESVQHSSLHVLLRNIAHKRLRTIQIQENTPRNPSLHLCG
ncbi:hypothetical protein FKM82_000411 [Ascaphus truei]